MVSPLPAQAEKSSGFVLNEENSLIVPWYTRRGLSPLSITLEPKNQLLKSDLFTALNLTDNNLDSQFIFTIYYGVVVKNASVVSGVDEASPVSTRNTVTELLIF